MDECASEKKWQKEDAQQSECWNHFWQVDLGCFDIIIKDDEYWNEVQKIQNDN